MKNTLLFVGFLYFNTCQTAFTQKVDLDRDHFYVSFTVLPSNPLDLSLKSYSVLVDGYLAETGLSERSLEDVVDIPGFKKLSKDADLDITVTIGTFRNGTPRVVSRVEERKDDKGKVISTTTYYAVEMSYDYPINAQMVDYKGNKLVNEELSARNQVYKSAEGLSSREVLDEFNRQYTYIRTQMMGNTAQAQIRAFSNSLGSRYGYLPVNNSKELIWILDSPKHPEYENHAKNIQLMKQIMTSMKSNVEITPQREAMKPVIDYFRTLPETYNKDEKADRKLRYSAFYALMKIYYWMEDLENAKFYANALIQNDYDTGDGKNMIKFVEFMENQFKVNNTTTRHFYRDVENAKMRSETSNTTNPYVEINPKTGEESKTDKTKQFLVGDWQAISIRFQKPVDLNKDGKISENALDEYNDCKRGVILTFETNNQISYSNKNTACRPETMDTKYAVRERDGKTFLALKDEFGDITSYEILDISTTLMKFKGGAPGQEAEYIYSKTK